jgi:hypothetical protein
MEECEWMKNIHGINVRVIDDVMSWGDFVIVKLIMLNNRKSFMLVYWTGTFSMLCKIVHISYNYPAPIYWKEMFEIEAERVWKEISKFLNFLKKALLANTHKYSTWIEKTKIL